MFLQVIAENPYSIFQESQTRIFISVKVKTEPKILMTVQLEDHFK